MDTAPRRAPVSIELHRARALERATLDRLAYLRGPRPPSLAHQRRMLREMHADALAILAALTTSEGGAA